MEKIIYDIWLKSLEKVNDSIKIQLLKTFGGSEAIYHASENALKAMQCINDDMIKYIMSQKDLNKANDIYKIIVQKEIKAIVYTNPLYPKLLKEIYDPPFMLYMRGNLTAEDESPIAIVGARKATAYGKWASYSIAQKLSEYSKTIVSGMAYGADTYAHKGALEGGGRTIAVLGCGVDICYPKANQHLMNKIIENGAVISEYEPGTPAFPYYFPARNRIISGLSNAIVVVEAGVHSGSLITAEYALEQGRDIYAVPGNIESIYSKGTNRLIKEGAIPLIDINGFLKELNIVKTKDIVKDQLGTVERKLLDIIYETQPVHMEILMNKLKMQSSEINALLTILEIKGFVKMAGKIVVAK